MIYSCLEYVLKKHDIQIPKGLITREEIFNYVIPKFHRSFSLNPGDIVAISKSKSTTFNPNEIQHFVLYLGGDVFDSYNSVFKYSEKLTKTMLIERYPTLNLAFPFIFTVNKNVWDKSVV